ncbi:tannase/feruloyl esterase family alpha/beta hydrolase, partial [Klebsiella pneumoniae]|uniref:tannase/feruloyl esterase family alpha/beta hydrolase n=1 Tax=Klebsiella pneumoniae TaxID=573 RepID=UPI003851FE52
ADRAAGIERTFDFFRMFVVPGMGHCSGGNAPNAFGALNTVAYPGTAPADPGHNILTALTQWVESGVAPEKLIASQHQTS